MSGRIDYIKKSDRIMGKLKYFVDL